LNLVLARYREQVKFIYIDPPYNTGSDEFVYKDRYQHSSWLTMMCQRLMLGRNLLCFDGVAFLHVDEHEQRYLRLLIADIFGEDNYLAPFIWIARAGKTVTQRGVQIIHEHLECAAKSSNNARVRLVEKKVMDCPYRDDKGPYQRELLRQWGGQHDRREERPTLYFPIRTPFGVDVYPIRPDGTDGCWRASREAVSRMLDAGDLDFVRREKTGEIIV